MATYANLNPTDRAILDNGVNLIRSSVGELALAAANSAHGDNQAIEVDATDQPGLYRVDWPDAAFAAGVREVILTVKCAGVFTEHLRVELDATVASVKSDTAAILLDTGTDGVVVAAGSKTGYALGASGIPVGAFAADSITASALAAGAAQEIRDAILAAVVEAQGSYTLQQALSIILAVLAGVTDDDGATIKTPNGSATRVEATINGDNERTAMTLTPSS